MARSVGRYILRSMKAHKGFALLIPLLVALGILVVGGVSYALVPRAVLKEYFQTGDKPTEAQFKDTLDSDIHPEDDKKGADAKEYNPTKTYQVGDTSVQSQQIYQAKVLTEAMTEFKLDVDQPVTFRWTTLVPKPAEPVSYRIKVWQLMEGQNGAQAMKSNQPIVTKDVTTGTEVTVNGLYTGPCKPPYLCDFVWEVEVMSKSDGSAADPGAR